jgi:hypothetical protein
MTFSLDQIENLTERKNKQEAKWIEVQTAYLKWNLSNKDAREYLEHGFLRRLGTIARCIQNIFAICPLDLDRKLSREEEIDLRIQLQSHIWNVFGCLDNLAWIWVYEKNVTGKKGEIPRRNVGLVKKCETVRKSLPPIVLEYLEEHDDWLGELENLRHALAHRIPLYVPPFALTSQEAFRWTDLGAQMWTAVLQGSLDEADRLESERDTLGKFLPVMTHSFEEKAPMIYFHPKVLMDFELITKLAGKLSSSF